MGSSQKVVSLLDSNQLTDSDLRVAARKMLAARMQKYQDLTAEQQLEKLMAFVQSLKKMPIALDVDATSEEMYEMPPEFFKLLLGKNLKYSSLYFKEKSYSIDQAEDAMLELYCERAEVKDGQNILDLGGGFGSLALFIATKYPSSKVTTLSYSKMHKHYIDKECSKHGIKNVKALNCDVSSFETTETYDRIFSIEMLEHLKNYQKLLHKISTLMKDDGLMFIEVYCNRHFPYHYEETPDDEMVTWIAKWFYTGGTMLSDSLLLYFQEDVSILKHWRVNGSHLGRSCELWAQRIDKQVDTVRSIFETVYGRDNATKWLGYWRSFYIISAEMFNFNKGEDWMVSHYLLKKKTT